MAAEPAHDYFDASDGTKLHYMTVGTKGSYVFLIHGYLGSAEGNWFLNGIAQELAKNHRVVAIDNRNHGKSDKPERGGAGKWEDSLELMDHLKIKKAHIHGYSMGGMITGRLLAAHPDRFITAGFGGSGIRESDPDWIEKVPEDIKGVDPEEAKITRNLRISAAMNNGRTREEAEKRVDEPPREPQGGAAARPALFRTPLEIDLKEVSIPVLAINGEYDSPWVKTFRMWRELNDFTSIVLPGKSHLTAIVAGQMPPEYIDGLVRFIDGNDT